MRIPLDTSTVFTFLATFRTVEQPIRLLPDVAGIFIESKFVLTRIVKFLAEPELPKRSTKDQCKYIEQSIPIKETTFSWHVSSSHATLEKIDLNVKPGEKIAIYGEVGSSKLTLLAEILGEVSSTQGTVQVYGKVAYVSQNCMDTNRNYVKTRRKPTSAKLTKCRESRYQQSTSIVGHCCALSKQFSVN
ncbi:hypothetical protein POM88_027822 [Heracleum sosnowskyi]|uniref:ABC transporter domain-containing protein n=1 Tax=Heracleum sosnowskyi TaxID=360622 RepID=A0AAD8MRE3_9APIA|nr:hypothetical protein POM88_027822 [Heracleum sosnowskyi]